MLDYVVAYLDVLGQKEKLNKLRKLPTNEEEEAEFIDNATQTYSAVAHLRDGLQNSLDLYKQATYNSIDDTPGLDRVKASGMKGLVEIEHQFSFFSDSIAVTSPYHDFYGKPAIQNIFGVLMSLSGMMVASLANRTPVRGAVEVGKGFGWPEGGVYGPIMSDVYGFESQIALYPRIVIGYTLHNCIYEWIKEFENKSAHYIKYDGVIEACKKIIYTDKDGMPTLDYLGHQYFQIAKTAPVIKAQVELGWKFVNCEYERYKDTKEPQMALRYSLLKEYYMSRLNIWDIQYD